MARMCGPKVPCKINYISCIVILSVILSIIYLRGSFGSSPKLVAADGRNPAGGKNRLHKVKTPLGKDIGVKSKLIVQPDRNSSVTEKSSGGWLKNFFENNPFKNILSKKDNVTSNNTSQIDVDIVDVDVNITGAVNKEQMADVKAAVTPAVKEGTGDAKENTADVKKEEEKDKQGKDDVKENTGEVKEGEGKVTLPAADGNVPAVEAKPVKEDVKENAGEVKEGAKEVTIPPAEANVPAEEAKRAKEDDKENIGQVKEGAGDVTVPTGEVNAPPGEVKPVKEDVKNTGEVKEGAGEVTPVKEDVKNTGEVKEGEGQVTVPAGEANVPAEEVKPAEGDVKDNTGEGKEWKGGFNQPAGEIKEVTGDVKVDGAEKSNVDGNPANAIQGNQEPTPGGDANLSPDVKSKENFNPHDLVQPQGDDKPQPGDHTPGTVISEAELTNTQQKGRKRMRKLKKNRRNRLKGGDNMGPVKNIDADIAAAQKEFEEKRKQRKEERKRRKEEKEAALKLEKQSPEKGSDNQLDPVNVPKAEEKKGDTAGGSEDKQSPGAMEKGKKTYSLLPEEKAALGNLLEGKPPGRRKLPRKQKPSSVLDNNKELLKDLNVNVGDKNVIKEMKDLDAMLKKVS